MTSPRVFAVQVPARRDGPRGGWVEKFDLAPAQRFGEVVRLLGYGNVPNDPYATRAKLRAALLDFDFDRDFLLLLGDPVACAMAVHVLAETHPADKQLRALKWDRRSESYSPYVIG